MRCCARRGVESTKMRYQTGEQDEADNAYISRG